MRTSQKERKENARRFYNMFINCNCKKAAVVVERSESTNPNICKCRFIAVPGSLAFMEKPIVLAESPSGMVGCFMEFLDNIKHCKQVSYYDDGFSSWLYDTYHFRITYRDGLVFMFEAMMICVSCNNWDVPRHILIESENFTGERLNELVLRCFEMYKTKAGLPDLELIDYTYYGDVETLKKETSDLYWVSFLVQESCCSKPWLNPISTGCTSLDEAMKLISDSRKKFRVLSAWIDTFENDIKSTVYHKCYVNAIGAIDSIKEGEK